MIFKNFAAVYLGIQKITFYKKTRIQIGRLLVIC